MGLPSVLTSAQRYISSVLPKGGIAVDATVGNGNDTLFLAKQVGRSGRVFGFDIQQEALHQTTERLMREDQQSQVQLFLHGHHQPWEEVLSTTYQGMIDAIMFNLGYLPHGDPALITKPETTIAACEHAIMWLKRKGIMTIVIYTGHPGGEEEAKQVVQWGQTLDSHQYQVMWQQMINRTNAPSMIVIAKQ